MVVLVRNANLQHIHAWSGGQWSLCVSTWGHFRYFQSPYFFGMPWSALGPDGACLQDGTACSQGMGLPYRDSTASIYRTHFASFDPTTLPLPFHSATPDQFPYIRNASNYPIVTLTSLICNIEMHCSQYLQYWNTWFALLKCTTHTVYIICIIESHDMYH